MTAPSRGGPDTAGVDPAEIVRQRSLGWPDFHPEDFCHQCGRPNPTWWVDSEHWNRAVDGSDRGVVGILCPSCFCALWEQKTEKTAIIWRLSIDPRSRDAAPPLATPTTTPRFYRLFRFLSRIHCPEPAYYWLLDRLTENNGWRPLFYRERRR